jgi:hypothetical protein
MMPSPEANQMLAQASPNGEPNKLLSFISYQGASFLL